MKKYLLFGAIALVLGACEEKPAEVDELKCGDLDVLVSVYKSRADAVIGEQPTSFSRTDTDTGTRYDGMIGDQTMALWNQGGEWIMVVGESDAIECVKKALAKESVAEPAVE
ncbi:MAG: hypothetical protein FWE50_02260 [Alphaproteobacteria bacterium]|nr:hypothetical protein [Alphaproteobacteria bacterium]